MRYLDLEAGNMYHGLPQYGNKGRKERAYLNVQLLARKTGASPKDSAKDISSPDIVRDTSIAKGKREGASVIRNNTICSVNAILVIVTE